MDARGRKTDHDLEMEERKWLAFGKFLLLVGLAGMFFLLAKSMVGHNFFNGELNHREVAVGIVPVTMAPSTGLRS
jgi:hypothetical protein